jgi:hypothetical protein
MLHIETVDNVYDLVLHFDTKLYITVYNGSFVTDRKRNTASILSIRHVSPFAQLAQRKQSHVFFEDEFNLRYNNVIIVF